MRKMNNMPDVSSVELEARLDALAAVATNGWSIEQRVQLADAAIGHCSTYAERLDLASQVLRLYAFQNVSTCLPQITVIVIILQATRGI